MIYSIRLVVEKRRMNEPPIVASEYTWRKPDLPSRMLFIGMVEEMYEIVELPYFPHAVDAEIEFHERIVAVQADEPVAPPEEVGIALWERMAEAFGES